MTSAAVGDQRPVAQLMLRAIAFYQRAISPTRPPRCRFVPSCSAYALEAVESHGAVRGGWLAVRRLAKCAPWHPGGVDLVPEPSTVPAAPGTDRAGRASSQSVPPPVPPADGAHADRARLPAPFGVCEEESSRA